MGVFGGGSSGGSQTVVNNSAPWSGAQPYLTDIMSQGQALYRSGQGQQYFPYSTVSNFSPQTAAGLNLLEDRALRGSEITPAAQGLAASTLRGDYLDPTQNPAYQTMMGDISNRVNSQFGAAGRTGSGAHAGALARGMTEGGAGIYSQERANQMGLLSMAPQLEGMDMPDIQRMMMAGTIRDEKSQALLDDQVNRFNFQQNAPWDALNRYSGAVSGLGSMGGTSTQTSNKSTGSAQNLQNLAGLGMLAYSMFSDIRLKENLEHVGTHALGVPVYEYNYLWDPDTRRRGVMAQDIAKVMPEAVIYDDSGFMKVDYMMIGGV